MRAIYTEDKLKTKGLKSRQIKAVISLKLKGNISNNDYRTLNNCSERTASSDLAHFVTLNVFEQIGRTERGTLYKLRRHKDAKDARMTPQTP
jgi:ATP-dependent DNA helicase RecG